MFLELLLLELLLFEFVNTLEVESTESAPIKVPVVEELLEESTPDVLVDSAGITGVSKFSGKRVSLPGFVVVTVKLTGADIVTVPLLSVA